MAISADQGDTTNDLACHISGRVDGSLSCLVDLSLAMDPAFPDVPTA
jgi:hypothetical protein